MKIHMSLGEEFVKRTFEFLVTLKTLNKELKKAGYSSLSAAK
jgi:hypothetical protein